MKSGISSLAEGATYIQSGLTPILSQGSSLTRSPLREGQDRYNVLKIQVRESKQY